MPCLFATEPSAFRLLLCSFVRELSSCRVMPDPKVVEHYPYRVTPCAFAMTLHPFVGMPYPLVGRISEEFRVDHEFGRRRSPSRTTVDGELERTSACLESSEALVVTPDERRELHLRWFGRALRRVRRPSRKQDDLSASVPQLQLSIGFPDAR